MKLRVLLPATLAIGIVSFVGTQANAFELLDGMLAMGGYGGASQKACCDSKAGCAKTECGPKQKSCCRPFFPKAACGPVQKSCCQKTCAKAACEPAQKSCCRPFFPKAACGPVQKSCCQKTSAKAACEPAQKSCCQRRCVPRLCLLSEASCRIRAAAADLQCKSQAACDAIKARLSWPRPCCQAKSDCAQKCGAQPTCGCGIPVQKGLEVQK